MCILQEDPLCLSTQVIEFSCWMNGCYSWQVWLSDPLTRHAFIFILFTFSS